jgi:hypothetical protein
MSTSRHPVALRLERAIGGDGRLLATVMGLPLVDGIFPALVLAGALSDAVGVVEVGLLVFGGSATLAVVLAEMDGTPTERARSVLLVGAALVVVAGIEAALAPTIETVIELERFERFAGLVVAAVAAKTASARIGEYLPRPAVIVGLGLVAAIDPNNLSVTVTHDPETVVRAVAAALVGVAFAFSVALSGPHLRAAVDIDRFRFGSAVALGLLTLSLFGLSLDGAPLAVLVVTGLLAYDPDTAKNADDGTDDTDDDSDLTPRDGPAPDETPVPGPTPGPEPGIGAHGVTRPSEADVDDPTDTPPRTATDVDVNAGDGFRTDSD